MTSAAMKRLRAEFLRDSWRELFRHDDYRSECVIQLYRAGVPAQLIEYAREALG